ncbi:hypothetical protein Tco_1553666 [Tanacetum coccineum]
MAGGTRVSKDTKVPSTPFPKSARPECINESDTDEDDIESSNGPLFGGGNQLEDEDFDFSDGYEDQVFDLPGQLKELRDFRSPVWNRTEDSTPDIFLMIPASLESWLGLPVLV